MKTETTQLNGPARATVPTSDPFQSAEPKAKERQHKEQTPKSMIPATVDQAQKGKAKLKESDIDVPELVAAIVTAKASVGKSFVGRKAGQHIDSAVAAEMKRRLGYEPTDKLSPKCWAGIQKETARFLSALTAKAEADYPMLVRVNLDVPTVKISSKTLAVEEFTWQSRVTRARKAASLGDERVGLNELLRAANNRLEAMLGIGKDSRGNPRKGPTKAYTREEIDTVKGRITALENRIKAIAKELGELTAKGNGKHAKANGKPKGKGK